MAAGAGAVVAGAGGAGAVVGAGGAPQAESNPARNVPEAMLKAVRRVTFDCTVLPSLVLAFSSVSNDSYWREYAAMIGETTVPVSK